jgi:hypothetical protein
MKNAVYFLIGFILIAISLSGSGNWSLAATSAVFGGITYPLFFPGRDGRPWAMLIGACAGMELLGTTHFGSAALYGLFIYGLVVLLADLARFTSEYSRFIVTLFIMATSYPLILMVPSHFIGALPQLLVSFVLLIAMCALAYRGRKTTGYELV